MDKTQFGRLTFVEEAIGTYYGKQPVLTKNWRLQCACGRIVVIPKSNATRGLSKSCGCYRREWAADHQRTHGHSKTAEYRVWSAMKRRCTNPNCKDFKEYGFRGVTVCDRWTSSFEAFLSDMGHRPSDKHSIDRIDPNGDYAPNNCRWASASVQQNNRRVHRRFEYDGRTQTVADWARELSIGQKHLRYRLVVKGMSVADFISRQKVACLPTSP